MIRPNPPVRNASPEPDSPAPPTPAPPGIPAPDEKPEVGPMGEPPGVPSPMPAPQRHDDLPYTIDPLGQRGARGRLPIPKRLRSPHPRSAGTRFPA